MSTPVIVMLSAAASGLLGLLCLFFNFMKLMRGGEAKYAFAQVVIGLWVGGSWATFLVGIVMFLIQWAKHA